MPDWLLNTPWWVGLGIVVGAGLAVFRIGGWVNSVNSARSALDTIAPDLAEIKQDLKTLLSRLREPTTQESSPIALTDFGRRVADELSVAQWAEVETEGLAARARGLPEFELFAMCAQHVRKRMDDDAEFQAHISAGAYNHGTDIEQIRRVYEVMLRDALLRFIMSDTASAAAQAPRTNTEEPSRRPRRTGPNRIIDV